MLCNDDKWLMFFYGVMVRLLFIGYNVIRGGFFLLLLRGNYVWWLFNFIYFGLLDVKGIIERWN